MIGDLEDLSLESKLQCQHVLKMIGIGYASADWLAAQIVLYRALNMWKPVAMVCMAELARRREEGDPFEYEDFIENQLARLPVPKPFDLKQVSSLMTIQSITKMITGKK